MQGGEKKTDRITIQYPDKVLNALTFKRSYPNKKKTELFPAIRIKSKQLSI